MEDFFKLFDERFTNAGNDKNAETILKSLCAQITQRWISDNIVATIITTSGDQQNYITYAVNLSIPDSNKYYSYRYIEVKQPIDSYFPVKISAFQNPPSAPKKIENAEELNILKN